MAITISSKAIVLTDYSGLHQLFCNVLTELSIDLHTDGGSLSSLKSLKAKLAEEGNTSFLKKDILSFIQREGYPFIVIIDMKTNTGEGTDNENLKILKTILLSYIIIMQSEQYRNILCNMVILMDKDEYSGFKNAHKHPQKILGILKTNDDRLNGIIAEYTADSEKFIKNFNILITDAEQEPSLVKSELVLFANMIKSKEKLKRKLIQEKTPESAGAVPKIDAALPADVLFRIDQTCYKNGETEIQYDNKLNLDEKNIYILGNFTSYTRLEVINRLLKAIKTASGNGNSFKKGELLTIVIPKESIIDSTTPITLAQLLSKELLEFKNIRIKTSPAHYHTMQQAKGFTMIQRNVIIQNT